MVEEAPLVPARAGQSAIGVEEAGGLLFVAGGNTGKAFVYDATTGDDVAVLTLTTGATFVNDVVVTRQAAFFTDSVNPVIYRSTGRRWRSACSPSPATSSTSPGST